LSVFRDLDFSILNVANFVTNLVGFSVMLLVPYFLVRAAEFPTWLGGIVLGCAPLGVALAGPLGGWAIERIGSRRVAFTGAVLLIGGLFAISVWNTASATSVLVASLILHGFGLGLFHVAYMHIVTGTLARSDRGVAGSLGMVTRSAGIVTGAAVLAGLFASAAPAAGFLAAFQTVFHYAALAFALFIALTLIRPRLWFR
jgi:MFS family permease